MSFHPARHRALQSQLSDIIVQLRRKYDPEKIIVFGSYAKRETNQWSDLDIAIVKNTPKRFVDRLKEVAGLIDNTLATDIIVYTPQEFALMKRNNYFVRDEIVAKGDVVYDKNQDG